MKRVLKTELDLAKSLWRGQVSKAQLESLRTLCRDHRLSVSAGDLQLLHGRWYVTHSGLIRLSRRNSCLAIRVQPVTKLCDVPSHRWVFRAAVYTSSCSKEFVGYGDADPSNTSPLVRGAEMRVAETRAVNRALRKAYGIGLCSVEELGSFKTPQKPLSKVPASKDHAGQNVSRDGHPRLRDRHCLLIRQHNLDPALVKAYAADFCGTATLKDASRDLVESFITQLAASAGKDRDALVCKLNSYAQPVEAKP